MAMPGYRMDTLAEFAGREIGVSGWTTIDQARIDAFADCTGDRQWIHVDVERARAREPVRRHDRTRLPHAVAGGQRCRSRRA